MSRRSKRGNSGKSRWTARSLGILAVLVLVGFVGAYGLLRRYLHSDTFRKFLSAEVSEKAGVVGEFAAFEWDGLAVETESFSAVGDGLVTEVEASGLRTEIGLGGVRRGVWEIRGSSVRSLEVSMDAAKVTDGEVKESVKRAVKKDSKRPAWLPSGAELDGAEVRDLAVNVRMKQGTLRAEGMRVDVKQAGVKGAYRAELSGGTLRMPVPVVPELRLERALVRYQDGRVFLSGVRVGAWENGRIEATGELDVPSKQFSIEGDATGVRCEDVLPEDWAKRLVGDAVVSFAVDHASDETVARGDFTIRNGTLTALPMLDALAAYADTRRFRLLTLNDARTRWQWKSGELILTDLVLASEGLVRLEGNIAIRGQQIDGVFRLGLAPGTLATLPGAETDVFLAGERGLLWAPLRVTGTLDDPKEDLSARLIAAAGARMFDRLPETGEEVIRFTRSLLGEPTTGKALEKGVKILGESGNVVREATGLLEGILGGAREDSPEKREE
jgi:hypothetical protein